MILFYSGCMGRKHFVERGNCNRLCLTRVSDCTYYLLAGEYCFTMTVVAAEDGFTGIYEAIVYCCCLDGKRTLKSLSLMDVVQGKKRPASNLKSPKGVCLPTLNEFQTGMFERGTINGIIYGLYNYVDPSEIVA
uniref:uncharacterized protein LOC122606324 n=1 Tax=Erigeron canadensis TaxID=72917 RepID=UPI001CB9B636|nr:uncharacterized protein LOC122606324 [Erigeron canadensis]